MFSERKKIFAIVGETCSGKDSITKKLIDKGYKAVCSYTTREKRSVETEGIEHYFVSKEKFDKIKDDNTVVAYTKIGDIEYMATQEELNKSDIYIIDPIGLKYLKEKFSYDFDIISIYLFSPYDVRKKRSETRGDDPSVFEKRCTDEKNQFNYFKTKKHYDYILYSLANDKNTFDVIFQMILSIINYELNTRDIKSETVEFFGKQVSKREILEYLDMLHTMSDSYKKYYIDDSMYYKNISSFEVGTRNLLLSLLR